MKIPLQAASSLFVHHPQIVYLGIPFKIPDTAILAYRKFFFSAR